MDYKEYLLNQFYQIQHLKINQKQENNQINKLSNHYMLRNYYLMYMNDLKLVKHAYLKNFLFNQLQNENESKDF